MKSDAAQDYLHFLFYIALLCANVWAILALPAWWWLPFSLLQGFFYVGLTEAFHQCLHMNLFPHRRANVVGGILFGTIMMGNFCAYRNFHLQHHQNLNTRQDPERHYYPRRQRNRFVELLMVPWIVSQYMTQVRRADLVDKKDKALSTFCEVCVGALIVAALVTLYVAPMVLVKVSIVPFLACSYIQYFVIQAEHFDFTPLDERPQPHEIGRYAFNLEMPRPFAFLILNTNYHGIHHRHPRTKWYQAPAVARVAEGQYTRGVSTFLASWYSRGPRVWADPASSKDA